MLLALVMQMTNQLPKCYMTIPLPGLSANTTQEAIDELATGGSVDADADPSNELQTLKLRYDYE